MIELLNSSKPKVKFVPRKGFKSGNKTIELELLYGHVCPVCNNVIQAFFKTDKPITLWAYEETTVLSKGAKNFGEVLKVLPNEKSEYGASCYDSSFSPIEGGSQKLILRNHILNIKALDNRTPTGENLFDKGEKCCPYTGIFSIREDLLVKDLCLFSYMQPGKLKNYNLPKINELITEPEDKLGKIVPTIGSAPPVVLINRSDLVGGFTWKIEPKLEPFRIKK